MIAINRNPVSQWAIDRLVESRTDIENKIKKEALSALRSGRLLRLQGLGVELQKVDAKLDRLSYLVHDEPWRVMEKFRKDQVDRVREMEEAI